MSPDETDSIARFARVLRGDQTARVEINAGGLGVWMALTCMAVISAMCLVGALAMFHELNRMERQQVEQGRQIRELRDYLSAIYAQAPHLKPEEAEKPK